jgi:hypothetical protein
MHMLVLVLVVRTICQKTRAIHRFEFIHQCVVKIKYKLKICIFLLTTSKSRSTLRMEQPVLLISPDADPFPYIRGWLRL